MDKREVINALVEAGAIGIIRVQERERVARIVEALHRGGLRCIEVTMTVPGAIDAMEDLCGRTEGMIIGAGTVLDGPTAR
ncbi:MAG: bifunctional 2-keto-4-hydroxyglutarate aldolase/2-keto-3-deoxy-6-phosphogluconate aldolase, partial [Deltaproteobacteria bacterium]